MKTKINNIQELSAALPTRSYSKHLVPGPPISLIILGRKNQIVKTFLSHGWYLAENLNIFSASRSAYATLFSRSYKTGPMYTGYVDGKPHRLGFERPTRSDTFKRRHHLRLWKTRYSLRGQPVWVGTISYDRGIGISDKTMVPIHHTNPTLRLEEDYLAQTFGIAKPVYIRLSHAERGTFYSGDEYIWDGLALVINATK